MNGKFMKYTILKFMKKIIVECTKIDVLYAFIGNECTSP